MAECPVQPETVAAGKNFGDWILLPLLCRPEAAILREFADVQVSNFYSGDTDQWQVFLHDSNEFRKKTGTYGGRVHLGHLTYTEIRFWGEVTLATPDGRKAGEYFSQGLTPSRLKRIPCVNDVINSLASLDPSTMAANSVVNIILPPKIPLDRCVGFLRAVSHTAIQSLQLNCTSREELLDAQKHPERYPHLIVRVTGFSAKFTSLSREWQDEVISRTFYE